MVMGVDRPQQVIVAESPPVIRVDKFDTSDGGGTHVGYGPLTAAIIGSQD